MWCVSGCLTSLHPLLGAAPGGERPPLSKGQHSPARRVHREVGLGSLPQLASAESHSGNIRVHACFLTSVWGFLCPDVELRAAWSDVLTVTSDRCEGGLPVALMCPSQVCGPLAPARVLIGLLFGVEFSINLGHAPLARVLSC